MNTLPQFVVGKSTQGCSNISRFVSHAFFNNERFSMARLIRKTSKRRVFLELEALENRCVPATISVGSVAQLQAAFAVANDNDVIEIANGTYSTAGGPINVTNVAKTLIVRPAGGASVTFDGGGASNILKIFNASNPGSTLEFTGLNFQNGVTPTFGIGGGVSVQNANAIFNNCNFTSNHANTSNGGGAVFIIDDAGVSPTTTQFNNCTFTNNDATSFGGAVAVDNGPSATFRSCIFTGNHVNGPGHDAGAEGGAIHFANTNFNGAMTLTVENSHFENNQAVFAGGAISMQCFFITPPFTSPRGIMNVSNSTFVNNSALSDPGNPPAQGGAILNEGFIQANVVLSRFFNNLSEGGGAIQLFQSSMDIEQSDFEGNRVTVTGVNKFGGAISAGSESQASDTAEHNKASLTIRDSYIAGPANTPAAANGAGIYITGDRPRLDGLNGVPQSGTVATQSAQLLVERTIFANLISKETATANGTGIGGAIEAALTNATLNNCLFMNNQSQAADQGNLQGSVASGGAIAGLSQSTFTINNSTFAQNFASRLGGALYFLGSQLNVTASSFVQNSIGYLPGFFDAAGGAIYTTPQLQGIKTPTAATGTIRNSIFTDNNGDTIYENDFPTSTIVNAMVYQANQFFTSGGINQTFFNNTLLTTVDANGLNTLIIIRQSGVNTAKSPTQDNSELNAAVPLAQLFTGPNRIHTFTAAGDTETETRTFVAWVISGAGSGALSTPTGVTPVTGPTGILQATTPGTFTLSAAGLQAQTSIIHPTLMIAGADKGAGAYIPIFDAVNGQKVKTLIAYDPLFIGGARVAMGDVTGDGVTDFIVCAGPGGGPDCRIYDGVTTNLFRQFFVYDPRFIGGTWVATGDVNGDHKDELITGADAGGGPNVQVFSFTNAVNNSLGLLPGDKVLFNFFAFNPAFIGGVRVGAGDIEGIGRADIICAAGPGGGPNITVFNTNVLTSTTPVATKSFFVFDPAFIGGVFATTGDVDGDGRAEIISGPASVGGPNVTVRRFSDVDKPGVFFSSFFAFDPGFTDSVRVASGDVLQNGHAAVIAGAGKGGGPKVSLFSVGPGTSQLIDTFFAFDPSFGGGIFVASK